VSQRDGLLADAWGGRGPFSPSSFRYTLSATYGSVNYSITGVPSWLTSSSTSGTVASGTTVTFTVNANANTLVPNTYTATITFANADTGLGTQTQTASLTVNPPPLLQVTPTNNMVASGTQGGPFSRLGKARGESHHWPRRRAPETRNELPSSH
jgi:Viral BACON domain